MALKVSLDFLRRFLPEETFRTLSAPTKDELATLGQRELPFPEEVDFLPREVVEEDRVDPYLQDLFGAALEPRSGPMATAPPPTQGSFATTLEQSLQVPPTTARPQDPFLDEGPLWAADPRAAQTPVGMDPGTLLRQQWEASQASRPIKPTPEMTDYLSATEFKTIYGEGDPISPPVEPGARDLSWWATRGADEALGPGGAEQRWTKDPPYRAVTNPDIERVPMAYGRAGLPEGTYQPYEIPGGRGLEFVPQDPANLPPPPERGVEIPTLGTLRRDLEDFTGEGRAQQFFPSGTKWDEHVEGVVQQIEAETGMDRGQLEVVWDRILGSHGDLQAAREEFFNVSGGILEHARTAKERGLDPGRAAQAYFNEVRGFIPGVPGEGFGENVRRSNTSWSARQAEDYGLHTPSQGFRGSEFDPLARQDFNPKERPLDVEEDYVVGQRPLETVAKRPGVGSDQVRNALKGSADLLVVPKGTLTPGKNRVEGKTTGGEVEVLKVLPFNPGMKPGFLQTLSKRSGIPVRNLQLIIDSGQPYEIAQVRRPSGKAPELPPEGRWRTPEELPFWQGDKGEAQRAKFAQDPQFVEKILGSPGARITRADQAKGKEVLAVVRRGGKPFAVVVKNGKKVLQPLGRDDKGQLTYNGKPIDPAKNLLERDPLRGEMPKPGVTAGGDPRDKQFARSSEGTTPTPEAYATPAPIEIKGLQLAPQPIREDLSKVGFALTSAPLKAKGGKWTLPGQAKDPKAAELTLVFTPRVAPNPKGIEFQAYEAGERELVNATPEQIREVLSRSNISKVGVKVVEGGRRGPAQATWERVKAILKVVKETPKGKALALAGAGALMTLAGEDKAEAAPRISGKESFEISKAAREALPNDPYQEGLLERAYSATIDQFEPVYRMVREALGQEDLPLREEIQTKYGGGGGATEIDAEPIVLTERKLAKAGLGEELNRLLTIKAGLRQWDVLERKRDAYRAAEVAAKAAGRRGEAAKARSLAKALDDAIAGNKVWEQGLDKETLSAHYGELQSEVGDKFASLEEATKQIYAPVRAKLHELFQEGLIDPVSYREYLSRGEDYIPTWKTAYEVDEQGNVTWKGDPLRDVPIGTSLQVREESIIKEVMGSQAVMKDPIDNAIGFIAKANQEIRRNQIAKAVVKTFAPGGIAKKVKTSNATPQPGNGLYSFMEGGKRVTYEMPIHLVEALSLVDKNFSREILRALPAGKFLRALASVPEAGVTTANVGFGTMQAFGYDPTAALIQVEWGKHPLLKVLRPYMRHFAKELVNGFSREWGGKESSPLRKRAGKANALYSGATSQILDPRDIRGVKGLTRAKERWAEGDFGGAVQETIGVPLTHFGAKVMKPFEEANKLATFGTLEDLNPEQSEVSRAYQTRKSGGSPDWAQSGRADHLLRYFVTFGRPALLGVEAALRAAKRNPGKVSAVLATTMAMELGRQSLNDLTADELGVPLEELDKRFSNYDQDNTYMVMIPPSVAERIFGAPQEVLSNGIERPFALKLPIPPILRLYTAPFKGLAKMARTGNPMEVPIAMADEMVPGSVPLEADALGETAVRRAGASLTAPVRVLLEQGMNEQFFTGAPVVGSRIKDLPAEDQYTDSTQPFYKSLGKATGGSPARLQHLGKSFLPGVFETPIQLLNLLEPSKGVPEVEKGELERLADIPFLGPAFLRRVTPQRYEGELGEFQDDFYRLSEQTKASAGAIRRFEKGIGELPSELVQTLGAVNPEVNAVVRGLAEIAEAKKQVTRAPGIDGTTKRAYMKQLTDQQRGLLKNFLSSETVQLLLKEQVPE